MNPLDRKLLRDLRRLWMQAVAAGIVLTCGIATFVMATGMSSSLEQARDAYYAEARMADLAASLVRAPMALADTLAELPDVTALEARTRGIGLVTLVGVKEPVSLQLLSLPSSRRPRVNDLVLRHGRWPDPERPLEALINEAFASEHRLALGERMTVIIRGRSQAIEIVGIASSPEYVFAVPPGELLPEPRRFGVLWMGHQALSHALDLDGAFNDVVFRLSPDADLPRLIAHVDRILAPHGGRGAYRRDRMLSARYLSDELSQLDTLARILPPIFLAVAAFLIHMTLTRLVTTERANIGLLKAFGYRDPAIGLHYLRFALAFTVVGSVSGIVIGVFVGRYVAAIYQSVYHLPSLDFQAGPAVWIGALGVGSFAAIAGALGALRTAVRLPPAVALAPSVPTSFRTSGVHIEKRLVKLGARLRMIVRRIVRFPRRSTTSMGGIALALGLLIIAEHFPLTIERLLSLHFGLAQRMDVTLAFAETASHRIVRDVAHLPGVIQAEPGRVTEVIFSADGRREREALIGLLPQATLNRIIDVDSRVIHPRLGGLTLSVGLAKKLGVGIGSVVQIEATSGHREIFDLPVTQIVRPFLGAAAYVEYEELGRWLREPDRVDAVHVLIDPAARPRLSESLKKSPRVVGATFIDNAERSLRTLFAQGSGFISSLFRAFAILMAVGVALSTARVTLGEQTRDLATLRVLGFDRRETSWVLLGELAVLLVLAIPLGWVLGALLSHWLMMQFETELFSFPFVFDVGVYAKAALFIVSAVALAALWVRRDVDHLDLVSVLKSHE